MARESTLIHEREHNFVPDHAIVETTGYDAIKEIMLKVLREMFSRHPEYTYVPDPERGWGWPDFEKTKIAIWEDYPLDTLFLPVITLNIGSVRDHPIGFNQNREVVNYLVDKNGEQVFSPDGFPIPIYFEYAGAWDVNFNITIDAGSPIERDVLTDLVKISIMHIYRDWLYTRGIHVKTLNVGGEEIVEWKNDKIYKTTISCELFTEWTHRIPFPSGPIADHFSYRIGMPITHSAIVPQGYIKEGWIWGKDGVPIYHPASRAQVTTEFFSLDKQPETVINTLEYNTTTNAYEITEAWWLFIAKYYIQIDMKAKYHIEKLADITVAIWLDSLASVSSPARLGYPKVIADLEEEIKRLGVEMGVDPESDLSGYGPQYNRIKELQENLDNLKNTYLTDVTRYSVG